LGENVRENMLKRSDRGEHKIQEDHLWKDIDKWRILCHNITLVETSMKGK
jgi:hypothetical protein